MAARTVIRAILIAATKLVILAAAIYLVCAVALRVQEANSPSSQDICDRVQLGMTTDEIESATRAFEGWQLLRDDAVMVISARSYRDKASVCRVGIDPSTHRATSKFMGPLQRGDWPTL